MRLLTVLTASCLPAIALAVRPAGEPIDDALMVDVTEQGFETISSTLPALVPSELPAPDISQTFSGVGLKAYLTVKNIAVDVTVDDIYIQPVDDALDIGAAINVAVNSPSKPMDIKLVVEWWWGSRSTIADCDLYVKPFVVDFTSRMYLDIVEENGEKVLDATIGSVIWDWTLEGTDIKVSNCWIGSINDLLEYIDVSIFDLVMGPIEGLIDDQVQGLVKDLEPTIEDAFNSFSLDEEFEFNDAKLHVVVEPSDVIVTPAGMRMVVSGLAEADPHPCVADVGIDGSKDTLTAVPTLGSSPDGIGSYDVGILASDDFLNQVLFAAYYGGALCFDMEGEEQQDLPINTSMFSLLTEGDDLNDLFPEVVPMLIEVRPTSPPEATPAGAHDITMTIDELQLDMYADLYYRKTLIVGLDMDMDAGIDLDFDGTTGKLDVLVDLSSENLTASTRMNKYAPDESDAIAGRVAGLFDTLAGPLIGGALEDLSFQLPTFGTVGLTSLDPAAAGSGKDWFGYYANAGDVAYGGDGCGGGCEDGGGGSGCQSGCGAGGLSGNGMVLLLLPLLGALIRRRRR